MEGASACKPCRQTMRLCLQGAEHPANRRIDGRQALNGPKSQPSMIHKLERKKSAAEGSRKENMRREEAQNLLHPQDFGVP
jgi:hypothetical protein